MPKASAKRPKTAFARQKRAPENARYTPLQAPSRVSGKKAVSGAVQKRLDAKTRKLILSQTAGGANSWSKIGAWWGIGKAAAYMAAHGARPVSDVMRQRARGYFEPRKLRQFIKHVAVPFLEKSCK